MKHLLYRHRVVLACCGSHGLIIGPTKKMLCVLDEVTKNDTKLGITASELNGVPRVHVVLMRLLFLPVVFFVSFSGCQDDTYSRGIKANKEQRKKDKATKAAKKEAEMAESAKQQALAPEAEPAKKASWWKRIRGKA